LDVANVPYFAHEALGLNRFQLHLAPCIQARVAIKIFFVTHVAKIFFVAMEIAHPKWSIAYNPTFGKLRCPQVHLSM
jgi:hypothetical protein